MARSFLSFCLGATYDTLPSPSNLHRWHIFIQNHLVIYAAKQCAQQLTFLGPLRLLFSWDDSLAVMIQFCRLFQPQKQLQNHINFVRFRTKIKNSMKKPHTGLLHFACDWIVMPDFIDKLVISSWIAISQLSQI